MSEETKTPSLNPSREMAIPDYFREITMPPFLKPEDFPIGSVIIGTVKAIVGNFTGKKEMDNTENMHLVCEPSGQEILFPVTGTLKQSLLRLGSNPVGQRIALKREANSTSKKYGNKMFQIRLFVAPNSETDSDTGAPRATGEPNAN